ncbi:unnamed protein product [Closterium sp. NIES-54]
MTFSRFCFPLDSPTPLHSPPASSQLSSWSGSGSKMSSHAQAPASVSPRFPPTPLSLPLSQQPMVRMEHFLACFASWERDVAFENSQNLLRLMGAGCRSWEWDVMTMSKFLIPLTASSSPLSAPPQAATKAPHGTFLGSIRLVGVGRHAHAQVPPSYPPPRFPPTLFLPPQPATNKSAWIISWLDSARGSGTSCPPHAFSLFRFPCPSRQPIIFLEHFGGACTAGGGVRVHAVP